MLTAPIADGRETVYLRVEPDYARNRLRLHLDTGAVVETRATAAIVRVHPTLAIDGWRVESLPALRRQGAAVLLGAHDAPRTSPPRAKVTTNRKGARR